MVDWSDAFSGDPSSDGGDGGGGDVDVDVGGGPDPGDVRVDVGDGGSNGGGDDGESPVDVGGGPNPGDVTVDPTPSGSDGGTSDGASGSASDGGSGSSPSPGDVQDSPSGDSGSSSGGGSDRDGGSQPPGAGPETIQQPEPAPTPGDVQTDPGGGDINERISTPNRPDPLDDTGQGLDQNPGQPGVQLPPLGGGPPQTPGGGNETPPTGFDGPDPTDEAIQPGETWYPGVGIVGEDEQGLERRRRFDERPGGGQPQGLEETASGDERAVAQSLEDEFLAQNPQFAESDVQVVREGDRFVTKLTASGEVAAARAIESQVLESAPGLTEDDIAVERRDDGQFFTRITGQGEERISEARREQAAAAIDEQVIGVNVTPEDVRAVDEAGLPIGPQSGQPAGFSLTEEAAQDIQEMQTERALQGLGIEGTEGDRRLPDSPDRATLTEERAREEFEQALQGIGIEGTKGDRRLPEAPDRPSLTEQQARQELEQDLEEQTGINLTQADIEFGREDGRLTAQLSDQGEAQVRTQQEPLVQLAQGTPLEGVLESTREFGAGQEIERRGRREQLYGRIGQREEASSVLEQAGLGGVMRSFEDVQAEARRRQQQLSAGVTGTLSDFGRAAERGIAAQAAFPAAVLSQAGVDSDAPDVPSPTEDPGAFATAATPLAAAEPTPFGELVLGAAVGGGAAFAARQRLDRQTPAARARATAEVPGMFPPEQEQPTEGIGRGFFGSELDVERSSLDLPELMTPTGETAGEGPGRLAPSELGAPTRPAEEPFPAEIDQPQEAPGRGFFQPEQGVPDARAAQAIQRTRETREAVDRQRRRQGSGIPDRFIPEGDQTIGERGGSAVGESPGPRFIYRPNPRSYDLYEIDTPEGGFRVGPELSRFLRAQTLEDTFSQGVEPTQAAGGLPAPSAVGGEFAAASAAGIQSRREQAGIIDLGMPMLGIQTRGDQRSRAVSRTGARLRAQSLTDELSDTRLAEQTQVRARGFGTPNLSGFGFSTPTSFENVDMNAPFSYGFEFNFPGEPRRRPRRRDDGGRDRDRSGADVGVGAGVVGEGVISPGWINLQATAQAGGGFDARGTPEGDTFSGLSVPTAAQADPDEFGLAEELEQVESLYPGAGDNDIEEFDIL